MTRRIILVSIIIFSCVSFCGPAVSQDDLKIWKEFLHELKNGNMTIDRIRPHEQLGDKYKPILLGYLNTLREDASPEDWISEPEVIRVDNRIQYITPWTENNKKFTFCFSFVIVDSQWYFQHLEAIFIRLDKIPDLPTSDFPDISEDEKNWAREEIYWTFIINSLYLPTVREKSKEIALNRLKDGAGYFVSAKTWVPFASPHKAFILYLCWEQAKLRGNNVTLEKFEDNEAIVHLKTIYFDLYIITAHMKTVISVEDYKNIFETIWQDRALNAGWNLDILYDDDYEVSFHFTIED